MQSTSPAQSSTTETFLQRVRDLVLADSIKRGTVTDDEAIALEHTKLLYGVGDGSYRGVTVYSAWKNGIGRVPVIEIAASAQESYIQLAGTTIHELAHVLTGPGVGHSNVWKAAAVKLGFTIEPAAAGQVYCLAMLRPNVREAVFDIAREIGDGRPEFRTGGLTGLAIPMVRPCSQGVGTRGGKSRGKGSGSRLRLYECDCSPVVKVRIASDAFAAHCDLCGSAFTRREV